MNLRDMMMPKIRVNEKDTFLFEGEEYSYYGIMNAIRGGEIFLQRLVDKGIVKINKKLTDEQ